MKRALVILVVALSVAFCARDFDSFPSVYNEPPIAEAAPTASGALSPMPLNNDFSDGLTNWTESPIGGPDLLSNWAFGSTTASLGDYTNGITGVDLCWGSVAGAMSSPAVEIAASGNESITSDPFTMPADGTPVTFRMQKDGGLIPTITFHLIESGQEYLIFTQSFSISQPQDVFTTCTVPSNLLGKEVQLKIQVNTGQVIVAFGAGLLSTGNDVFMAKPGDPVDAATGTFSHEHTDIAIPGKGIPLSFTRRYSSAETSLESSMLGYRWFHNYESNVVVLTDDSVVVQYPDSRTVYFEHVSGTLTPPVTIHDTLVKNVDDTHTLTTTNQVSYKYDTSGRLESILDRNGQGVALAYDGSGLNTATDSSGRVLDFTIISGRITQIDEIGSLARQIVYMYDAITGDLIKVTDVRGGETEFTYSEHRLLTIEDSLNLPIATNVYDSASRVVEQTDAEGGVGCFYYGHGPAPTSTACPGETALAGTTIYVDPEGNKTTYYFDTQFRTTDVENAREDVTTYTYETPSVECNDGTSDLGNLCKITDPLLHTTEFTYDDDTGNRLTVTNALSKTWTYTYNSNNDVLTETDPVSNVTTYAYDVDGNLTSVTNDLIEVTTFNPNPDGTLESVTDFLTHKTSYTYDANGNPATVVNAESETTTFNYDNGGRLLWEEDALFNRTEFTYDNQNNVKTITDPETNVTMFDYDAKGQRTKVTDANLYETSFTYDKMGRLLTVTDELDQVVSYTYDANGNRKSLTNPRRQTVLPTAETGAECGAAGTGDGLDNEPVPDGVVDDGCPSLIYTIDVLGRVENITDSLGNLTTYVFDDAGRLFSRNDNKGDTTTYEYFDNNSLKKIDYPVGTTDVSFTYDDVGNRKTMLDETGTTTYTYDDLYRPISINDGGSNTVGYDYDGAGRLIEITYPGGTDDVTYAYDDANRLTDVTDWLSNATSYVYDVAGRLETTAYPTGTGVSTSYAYDMSGRLLSMENSKGSVGLSSVAYTLDPAGMRTSMLTRSQSDYVAVVMNEHPAAYWRLGETAGTVAVNETANLGLDATYMGSPALGVAGAIFGDTDTAVDFDGFVDFVQSPTDPKLNSESFSIELWANPDQLRVQDLVEKDATNSWRLFMNDTAGHIEFDALADTHNCSTSGTDTLPANEYTHIVATYDDAADEAKIYLNGTLRATCSISDMGGTYNAPLEIGGSSNNWDGQLDDVAYYCCALKAEDVLTHAGALTTTYENDQVYQLTDVAYPNSDTETFTYDAMGNRETRVFNGSTTSYTYNAGERMTDAGGVTYTYDNNGNLTDRGTADDFGWDHENRLTSTTINSASSTYDYNGDGLRMSRTIGATTTDYVWDMAAGRPAILEDSDGMRYLYGLDLIARIDGSSEEYYLADGLGSTTALTDDTGNVTVEYAYDAFGNYRPGEGSSTNEFTYAGEQVDETGLQYLRARYYDPAVGRFLNQDPLPLVQRYAYAANSPVNLVDKDGNRPAPPKDPVSGCGGIDNIPESPHINCPSGPLPPYQPRVDDSGCIVFGCFLFQVVSQACRVRLFGINSRICGGIFSGVIRALEPSPAYAPGIEDIEIPLYEGGGWDNRRSGPWPVDGAPFVVRDMPPTLRIWQGYWLLNLF